MRKFIIALLCISSLPLLTAQTAEPDIFFGYARYNMASPGFLAFSPDARFLAADAEGNAVNVWDLSIGMRTYSLKGHTGSITCLTFSEDGKYLLSGSMDRTLILWDMTTGDPIQSYTGHTAAVRAAAFYPGGKYILSGCKDGSMKLWDVKSGNALRGFKGHKDQVLTVDISRDGNLAISGGIDNMVIVWNVKTGELLRTFKEHNSYVDSVKFTPDGKTIVSTGLDSTIKTRDTAGRNPVTSFPAVKMDIAKSCLSADCSLALINLYDFSLNLWDIGTERITVSFPKNQSVYSGLALSTDSKRAAAAGMFAIIELFNGQTGGRIARMVSFYDGEWVFLTGQNFYRCSAKGEKHLQVMQGERAVDLVKVTTAYKNAAKVEELLAGE